MSNQGTGRTAGGFAPRGSAALTYSTFLGGTRSDVGNDIAVAGDGSVYVTGTTDSFDFPAQNPPPPSGPLASNVFVAKLSATTAANPTPTLLFATYLGGIGLDEGRGIALDCNDNVYVAGVTSSFDFPTTANAPQPDHAGGTDVEFPTDAFVAKLNASGSALLYATYLGGSNEEFANNIAVDASRLAYITGVTTSGDLPLVHASDTTRQGSEAFVVSIGTGAAGAKNLLYSTYVGGSGADAGLAIALDAGNNPWITGRTTSLDIRHCARNIERPRLTLRGVARPCTPHYVRPSASTIRSSRRRWAPT